MELLDLSVLVSKRYMFFEVCACACKLNLQDSKYKSQAYIELQGYSSLNAMKSARAAYAATWLH